MASRTNVVQVQTQRKLGPKRALSFIYLLCLLLLLLGSTFPALAESKDAVANRRDVDITILENGDIRFVETWEINFTGGPFSSAYRTIDSSRLDTIDSWQVSEGSRSFIQSAGAINSFFTSKGPTDYTIRWTFPETTDQVRTFQLSYTVHGGLRIYDGGDQLWWYAIESSHSYPVLSTTVTVHLPEDVEVGQIRTGIESQNGSTVVADSRTVIFETRDNLSPGSPFIIRLQFPHGLVAASPPAWQLTEDKYLTTIEWQSGMQRIASDLYPIIATILFILQLLLAVVALRLLFKIRNDRTPKPPENDLTEPPVGISPAILDLTIESKVELRHLLATIFDLARRGILAFRSAGKGVIEIRLERLSRGLTPFENALLAAIYGKPKLGCSITNKELSQIEAVSFYKLSQHLRDEAVRLSLFTQMIAERRKEIIVTVIGIALCAFSLVLSLLRDAHTFPWLAVAGVLFFMLVVLLVPGETRKRSPKGLLIASQGLSFKHFLCNVQETAKPEDLVDAFSQYLPYAVSFGVEKQFVQAFAGVPILATKGYLGAFGVDPNSGKPILSKITVKSAARNVRRRRKSISRPSGRKDFEVESGYDDSLDMGDVLIPMNLVTVGLVDLIKSVYDNCEHVWQASENSVSSMGGVGFGGWGGGWSGGGGSGGAGGGGSSGFN